LRVHDNTASARFVVTDRGRGMAGQSGLGLVAELADALGLTAELSRATRGARRWALHDPGKVLRDLALTLVAGGDALRHMAVMASRPEVFGAVASAATACRTVVAVAGDEHMAGAIAAARKLARETAWDAGGAPPVVASARAREHDDGGGDAAEGLDEPLALDVDATLSLAHSDDKDGAGATYKGSWGFHPLLCYLDRGDGLGEALAGMLRPGNAGANNAADHVSVFDEAAWQLPDLPAELRRLVRADSAGCSHVFLEHVRAQQWEFSVGFALAPEVKAAIRHLPEDAWVPAITQDGAVRAGAHVAELTGRFDLTGWPDGSRLLVRREPLHPGAQQTLDDVDGYRFTALLTDQPEDDLAALDARHRAHARVEDRIRAAKDTGLRTLPCDTFARNALWLELVLIAQDLTAFTQALTLDGELRLAEPQQLRYKLLHTPARIARRARKLWLHIQGDWPWGGDLVAAFARLRDLPLPAT
jgi:hypothetical protein